MYTLFCCPTSSAHYHRYSRRYMSQSRNPTGRTDPKPTDAPTYHQIAARLGVDAEELRLFVDHHPNPTPPIVLGWAKADPEHGDAVERWLDERKRRQAEQAAELEARIDEAADGGDERLKFTEGGK